MTTPDHLATLLAYAEAHPPRTPRHPAPGCPCADCCERDDYLEGRAEARKEARAEQVSGREADRRAGFHYPEGP